jgi:4-amino-4-deoxy-L-arabinose transferase-like glycosyltransferase
MVTLRMNDFADEATKSVKKGGELSSWASGSLLVLLSAILYAINIHHGIGVLPDSIRYMRLGYEPFDAPLYPWLLDVVQLTGVSVESAATITGLFFVCANSALVWFILARSIGNTVYAIGGTIIITMSPQFVSLHALALSEPTFLFFLLASVLAVFEYFESENRIWLIVSAVALGLATLARFTAPPLGLAIVLALFLDQRKNISHRLKDILLFGLISGLIFICWLVISNLMADRSIGREMSFHGNMGVRQWLRSLESLVGWLMPKQIPFSGRVVAFVLIFLMSTWLTVNYVSKTLANVSRTNLAPLLVIVLGVFSITYLLFVLLATMIEANLSLTPRYAFPAYVTTAMMMAVVLSSYSEASGNFRFVSRSLLVVFIVVIAGHTVRTATRSSQAYREGIGFSSLAWTNSPTIQNLKQLPVESKIYSNAPDVVTFILRRKANLIPQHVRPRTGLDDPIVPYADQLQALRNSMTQPGSYMVMFDKVDWRFYLATEKELVDSMNLEIFKAESDGRIYVASNPIRKE